MSKYGFAVALVCAVVAIAASAGLGMPTISGATGIVATPNADVVPVGWYDLALDYQALDIGSESLQSWPLRVVGGVANQAELGIAYSRITNEGTGRILGFNGKFQLLREGMTKPAISVGANFSTFSDEIENATDFDKVTTLYLVLSKTISGRYSDGTDYGEEVEAFGGPTVRASVGVMYNRYKDSLTVKRTKPFVGLEFNWGKGTTLALEYKVKEKEVLNDEAISSVVFRHQFSPNLTAQIGMSNALGPFAADKHGVILGISYRWGVTEELASYE